jgi:aryl-alcohol dehydrogenase-like predicted oxidoreductase
VPLACNQVRYSLLDRRIEQNGVLETARELGITIIAYSPLALGLLSGKFHESPGLIRERPGFRKWMRAFRKKSRERTRPLVDALREIGEAHGATPSQIALAWVIGQGGDTIVAIPGATKRRHAEDNAAVMGLVLTAAERQRLDELSRPYLG